MQALLDISDYTGRLTFTPTLPGMDGGDKLGLQSFKSGSPHGNSPQ